MMHTYSSRMPEYELRDYLESIQDRAVEALTAELPPQGDSTQVPSEELGNRDSVKEAAYTADGSESLIQERGTSSSETGGNHSKHGSLIQQRQGTSTPGLRDDYARQWERERSMTVGAG